MIDNTQRGFGELEIWKDSEGYYEHLKLNSNFVAAFQLLKPDLVSLSPKSIIDLGAGVGWTSALIGSWLPAARILSTDTNVALIANRKYHDLVKSISTLVYNIERTPLSFCEAGRKYPKEFDLAIAAAAIHHSNDIRADLRSIRASMRDGGILIFANELLLGKIAIINQIVRKATKFVWRIGAGTYSDNEQAIMQGRVLYDGNLGDWFVDAEYLIYVTEKAGFKLKKIYKTEYFPYKNDAFNGNIGKLGHFIFEAV
jgi:SAM-dependent methyltransferase